MTTIGEWQGMAHPGKRTSESVLVQPAMRITAGGWEIVREKEGEWLVSLARQDGPGLGLRAKKTKEDGGDEETK
jgi:hypothetical protein